MNYKQDAGTTVSFNFVIFFSFFSGNGVMDGLAERGRKKLYGRM